MEAYPKKASLCRELCLSRSVSLSDTQNPRPKTGRTFEVNSNVVIIGGTQHEDAKSDNCETSPKYAPGIKMRVGTGMKTSDRLTV